MLVMHMPHFTNHVHRHSAPRQIFAIYVQSLCSIHTLGGGGGGGGGGWLVDVHVHVTIFLQWFGKTYTLASPASAVTFIATDSRLLLQDKPKIW